MPYMTECFREQSCEEQGVAPAAECLYVELPRIGYQEALKLQQGIVRAKTDGLLKSDVILNLEHPPVYTLGRRGGIENLCVSKALLEKESIDIVQVERGGDITYHGPGQLVIYTLIDIQRARIGVADLVSALEAIMIALAAAFGIEAQRNPLNRGVWIGNEKLGSIGLAIRKGVTSHGLALNVNTDLTHFSWINPCGLQNVGMTSLEKALSRKIDINDARRTVRGCIETELGVKLIRTELEELKNII